MVEFWRGVHREQLHRGRRHSKHLGEHGERDERERWAWAWRMGPTQRLRACAWRGRGGTERSPRGRDRALFERATARPGHGPRGPRPRLERAVARAGRGAACTWVEPLELAA